MSHVCTIESSLIETSYYSIPHVKTRKTVNLMAPKSDHKWCETTPIRGHEWWVHTSSLI